MVQPGKKELLPFPCSARDSRECTGDTGCFVQQGADSLGAETLSGLVLAVAGWRCFLELSESDLMILSPGLVWTPIRGSSWLPGGRCVGCGDVQLLDLLSYLLGQGISRGAACFFFMSFPIPFLGIELASPNNNSKARIVSSGIPYSFRNLAYIADEISSSRGSSYCMPTLLLNVSDN
ncbi:hypothetical protein L1987_33207 [Smallanthus sonchifolius]|uniref:Uncharacterized protein n=1 Tax=Smallanthus sonchifolius TaxID=185202 RepID=A0ACB9HQQ1_9ASTR|nr:hypothetical protein L1987_33207 [Smallanthus sonchifolius]